MRAIVVTACKELQPVPQGLWAARARLIPWVRRVGPTEVVPVELILLVIGLQVVAPVKSLAAGLLGPVVPVLSPVLKGTPYAFLGVCLIEVAVTAPRVIVVKALTIAGQPWLMTVEVMLVQLSGLLQQALAPVR